MNQPRPMTEAEIARLRAPVTTTAPQRVQRLRSRGAKLPDGTVYVGRPTKWGNPFVVGSQLTVQSALPDTQPAVVAVDLELSLELYQRWVESKIRLGVLRLDELRGRHLACWCSLEDACHADILLELANR